MVTGEPELDDNFLNSKQHKRAIEFERNHHSEGVNGDWLKMQAWQSLPHTQTRADEELWENFGPDTVSGRIISIAFHPTDENTFLVGAAAGGLWRTTDYGESWEVLTDDFYTMGVGAVAYNPQNPNSILIATGEGYDFNAQFTQGFGVLISHDSGSNWEFTELMAGYDQNFAGTDIYWNTEDTTKVVVASTFGVYFSNNGGLNYAPALDRMGGRMIVDPLNADRVYFAARYYSATFPGGLYISVNSGESWTLSGAGLPIPEQFGFASLSVHPIENNVVFALVSQSPVEGSGPMKGLYKSVDFGLNFSEIASTQDLLCYPAPYDDICQGWFANTILVAADDVNTLYAGGTRFWKSINGGIDWELKDINPDTTALALHADHHQTLYHPLTGDLFDCNDGGANYTADGGVNWTSISDGLITHQFYSVAFAKTDPNVVIGGTQDVGTFTSTNAHTGGNWGNPVGGDTFRHAISPTDENVWYGTHYSSYQRFRTTDAGMAWNVINDGTTGEDQWLMPICIHPSNPNIMLTSDYSYIYKSVNAGTLWTPVATPGSVSTIEFDIQNPLIVYASQLFGGNVYRSVDGGDTWSLMASSPGSPITDLAADPIESGKLYATIGSYAEDAQLFVSINAGETWNNITNDLPQIPTNAVAISPYNNDQIYVANDFGVWFSPDGGTSYEQFSNGLPNAIVVNDIHYYAPDTSVRIGTYGRGYWKAKAQDAIYAKVDKQEEKNNPFVFPNPSQDRFYLSAPVGYYAVYDQLGNLLMRQDDLEIDLSSYPPGIYYLTSPIGQYKLVHL